jgi:predicted lipoprotein with Yx(FWY)xxD motif/mono/diheme cytochrome c family protein
VNEEVISSRRVLLALIGLTAVIVLAQEPAGATVRATTVPEIGTFLVDGEGRSVYMFTADSSNESTCMDGCVESWPPVLVEGELVAGEGVAATLLGTFERPDGTSQASYFGIPLYYSVSDLVAGDTNGQSVDDTWFLVSPFGTAIVPPKPATGMDAEAGADEVTHMELAALMGTGRTVFMENCATCHGTRGEGGVGPNLAGRQLNDDRRNIRQVVLGGHHMPGFGHVLDDEQVAAVLTFIRKSWGNDFPVVTPEEVVAHR